MKTKHHELKSLDEKLRQDGGRILVIQTAFLGDVILLTPLIVALQTIYPESRITLVTNKIWADILPNLVDNVIAFDKKKAKHDSKVFEELVSNIRSENFDLAIIPHRSFRSGFIAKQAGVKHRIGFNRGEGKLFHTVKVNYPQLEYEGKRNLRLLAPLTTDKLATRPLLKPSELDYNVVNEIISAHKLGNNRYIVVAPGSVWHTKRWSESHYSSLITMIKGKHDVDTFLIGGVDDQELCDRIALKKQFNLAGQLTPLQSCALIKESELVVSGDSAPAHMATAMRQRQVIILGSTTPRFGFVGDDDKICRAGVDLWCRPCTNHGRNSCPLIRGNLRCLSDILPLDIYNLVKDWLQ